MTEKHIETISTLMTYISETIGPSYELILYIIEEKGIVARLIENGYISGAKLGDCLPASFKEIIYDENYKTSKYKLNYKVKLEDNKLLRASTLYIRENEKLVGFLNINFDDSHFQQINDSLLKLVHPDAFVENNVYGHENVGNSENTTSTTDTKGLIEEIFHESTKNISLPLNRLTQEERTKIIAKLYEAGMFELKGAVQYTISKLGCSQASIYRYIKNAKEEK